ncbi:26S proteasome non-ATPase regulatory subunit 6 [Nowakowskiella sp. JEL0407]|nr:26S proteasome non-ATPase regulatory subunit 6 [Nowakowskiella sp. JEL0407]
MTDQSLPKIPNLDLARLKFLYSTTRNDSYKSQLLTGLKNDEMAPYLHLLTTEFNWKADSALIAELEKKNAETLKSLEGKLADAEQNLGETDISDALIAKAQYLAQIGEKDKAISAYRVAYDKTGPLGHRIDMIFALIRIGFFFNDNDLISRNIEKVKTLIEEGGDWDRRNRLKVYEGIYLISIRNFKTAADLLLDTLATFTSTELMSYKDFVRYAAITAAITLKRPDFKKRVIDAPEILEVIHDIPNLESYCNSLYKANYALFFKSLAAIEQELKLDWILSKHYSYYVREMRIIAYTQLLESYQSVTIESMAASFNVSQDYIDSDLSKFIAAGRINAVVDKVGGIIETNRPDAKNAQYQACIKQGDILLNRIQNLSLLLSANALAIPSNAIVVALDGSGKFKSIQAAVNSISSSNSAEKVIYVKAGTYNERVTISRNFITLVGDGKSNTIITGNANAGGTGGSYNAATVTVRGSDFRAFHMTFKNTAPWPISSNGQAPAFGSYGARTFLSDCNFISGEDTVFVATGQAYFTNCYIAGDTDFIYGEGSAIFDNVNIYVDGKMSTSVITAHGGSDASLKSKFWIRNSRITTASNVKAGSVFLGRPWKKYAYVIFSNTVMPSAIAPAGWTLSLGDYSSTCKLGEIYGSNTGSGSSTSSRVQWATKFSKPSSDVSFLGASSAGLKSDGAVDEEREDFLGDSDGSGDRVSRDIAEAVEVINNLAKYYGSNVRVTASDLNLTEPESDDAGEDDDEQLMNANTTHLHAAPSTFWTSFTQRHVPNQIKPLFEEKVIMTTILHRGTATGIASALGRIVGVFAPILAGILFSITPILPLFALFVFLCGAAICMVLLPVETKNQAVE